MYITNISLFVSRVTVAFLISLVVTAAYSQHKTSGTSEVADNIQLKPSGRIKQNNNLLIAQIQTGNCRQPGTKNVNTLNLGGQAANASDSAGFYKPTDCPEPLTRQIKKTELTSSPKKLSMQVNFEFNSARHTPVG
ncbi:MAG: hypothetical protein PHD43_11100 [Methylococcales bacterium]|nr:hypothetical protein [Methylococcales bacterium]